MKTAFSMRHLALCLLFLGTFGKAGATATPPEMQGAWEVTQVALDTKDQPHWRYEPNDPRILGRILQIGADGQIAFNYKRERCDHVAWSPGQKTTLAALIAKGFPRPPKAGLQRSPTLVDFELKLPNHSVTPVSAVCTGAGGATDKAARWGDAWFASVDGDKLVIGYDGDTVLVLMKAKSATAPTASFSCHASLNPAESAVCGSPALAGFDRSVAAAYKRSLRRRAGDSDVVKAEQRDWVKLRNSCQSELSCLEDRMRDRIDALMQD